MPLTRRFAVAALTLATVATVAGCSSSATGAGQRPSTGAQASSTASHASDDGAKAPTAANVMASPSYYAADDLCGVARAVVGDTAGSVAWVETPKGADRNPDSVQCTLTDPGHPATTVRLELAKQMVFDDVAAMFRSEVGDPKQCQGKATNPAATLAAARETTLLCPGAEAVTFVYEGEFTDASGGYISLEVHLPPTVTLDGNRLQSWLNAVQDGLNAAT